MFYTWELKFVLLLSHFLVNVSATNIDKDVSVLFSQSWSNSNEHTLTQLSFSTKYQRWNNVSLPLLNRRSNSIDVVSMLFCQRLNHADKYMMAQLSFSNKNQRQNNVDERCESTLFQRWFNGIVFAGKLQIIRLAKWHWRCAPTH